MATSAIPSNDLSLIRNGAHQLTAVRLNAVRPEIVATYAITPGSQAVITDLSGTLTSGTVADVLVGRRVVLTDGTYKQYTTVRKTSDASNLYVNVIGEGQAGFPQPVPPAQSQLTTANIYNDFILYGEYSRVVSKSKPILPRWDLAFSNQTSSAIPPICNTGTHQSATVEYGATASFTLPRLGSDTSFAFGGETISSVAYTLPTGVTLRAGYSLSDAVIEVDAVAGQHLITRTVTDSNSQTHTAYVWLFVDDGITYKTLNTEFQAQIVTDTRDLNGRRLEINLYGQLSESALLPGTMVHLQTEQTYSGQTLTDGVIVDTFIGYVSNIQPNYNGNIHQNRITVVSPYIYLQSIATAPQVIFEKNNPSNWTEVTSALSNPRGALSYIRWQCQNLFALHDIDCPYTEPRKISYEFSGSTVGSHLNVIAEAIAGNVGSASDGTLVVRKSPVLRDNTFRNALAVGCTFSESDIVGEIGYNEPIFAQFQDVRSGAFAYNGSKKKAWYGVKRWEQGAGRTEQPYFTVTTSEGRDTVLEIVGHMAADLNYPVTNNVTLNRDFEVIDPVYLFWYRMNVSSDYDARGRGWSNVRIVPQSISTQWDLQRFTRVPTLTFKQETFGQPSEEYFLPTWDSTIQNGWEISRPVPFQPLTDLFGDFTNIALLLNTSGQLAITQNLVAASPTYFDLSPYVTGNANDVCYDYNSAFFTSGYILTEALSVYIVSTSGTSLYIYRLDDVKAQSINITLLQTYTMADSSNTTNARIACSRTTPTLVVTSWHDQTGIEFGRSTDGGATWSSKANVGSAGTDTANDNASIGLYLSGNNQVLTGFDGTSDYGVYLATTTGGTPAKLTNSEDNTAPNAMITGDDNTTLYVATSNDGSGGGGGSADYNGDFDGGDIVSISHYQQGAGTPTTTQSLTASGNPDYAGSDILTALTLPCTYSGISASMSMSAVTPTNVYVTFDYWHDVQVTCQSALPPSYGYIFYNIRFFSSGTPVSASTLNLLETSTNDAGAGVVWNFSNAQTWTSVDHGNVSIGSGINSCTIQIYVGYNHGYSADTEFRVDNIRLYVDSVPGSAVAPLLYKVTTYTATDSWSDVTPATDYVPLLPYGLILDKLDTDNVEAFATDTTTPKWFSSTNTATSWTDNGASDYRTGIKVGNAMLLGGVDAFDLTQDNGTTVVDKLGNLGLVWGSVGTIKKIQVVTE